MKISSCVRLRCTYSFLVAFCIIINTAISEVLPSILWSIDNPFFENLRGEARTVFSKDRFHFICPNDKQYTVKKSVPMDKDSLFANIYMVDEQGYENCNSTGGLKIIFCDKPTELKDQSLLVNDQASLNDIPVFHVGKTNYFIDTSFGTQNTLKNHDGGRCKTHKMKMKIYVCTGHTDPKCPSKNKVSNGGWSEWGECKFGSQSRQCNNPAPANGGFTCEGNATRFCTPDVKPTATICNQSGSENYTSISTPIKGKRTSVADTLGTLSVGVVVMVFLVIFIAGCLLGLIAGVLGTHNKLKHFVVKRRPERSNNNADRNSFTSSSNFRPTSFASILSNITGVTNLDSPLENVKNDLPDDMVI